MNVYLKNLLGCLFVVLFLGYYGVSTTYTHAHKVHGILMTHSHPFAKANGQTHQHSTAMFHSIQGLSLFFVIIVAGWMGCILFRKAYKSLHEKLPDKLIIPTYKFCIFSPRSPSIEERVENISIYINSCRLF